MEIRPVQVEERSEALGRLIMGSGALSAAQRRKLDEYAEQLGFDYRHLWAAFDDARQVKAAAMLVPRPGKTAMLFHNPVRRHDQAKLLTRVIDAGCHAISRDEATMAQALLNIGDDLEQWMLEETGFERLAVLEYMQCDVSPQTADVAMPDGVTLLNYDESRRPLFVQALDGSYEQTLDCPGLRGLRDTDDVLIGHRCSGLFDPTMWHVAMSDGQPAGVILLNQVPQQSSAELVYLGVCASARGRGLATALMRHGLWLCAQRRWNAMSLAVDQTNTPAMKLYRNLGFTRTSRKIAMIRRLPPPIV